MTLFLALLPLLSKAIPEAVNLVKSLAELRKKYPEMTPEQISAIVAAATAENEAGFDAFLASIQADQQANK